MGRQEHLLFLTKKRFGGGYKFPSLNQSFKTMRREGTKIDRISGLKTTHGFRREVRNFLDRETEESVHVTDHEPLKRQRRRRGSGSLEGRRGKSRRKRIGPGQIPPAKNRALWSERRGIWEHLFYGLPHVSGKGDWFRKVPALKVIRQRSELSLYLFVRKTQGSTWREKGKP